MNRLKLGMIGFAHPQARNYLERLLERDDAEMIGIYDTCKERMDAVQSRYGIRSFADCEGLLAGGIDAVIVCSETKDRAGYVKKAAMSGKHVLCEKPLGLTLAEMREMLGVCAENKVQLMTAFPYRYLPSVLETKAILDSGSLGTVLTVTCASRVQRPEGRLPDPSISGGAAVMDQGVPILDLLRWLLNAEPIEVYAETGPLFLENATIDDAGIVHATFDNDVKVLLDSSWSLPGCYPIRGDLSMEIVGTKGVLALDAFAQVSRLYSDRRGKAEWSYWGDHGEQMLIHDFVRSLMENREVPITGADGLRATAAALAACESVKRKAPCSPEA
ncbi:Gfo/Idh/MocA family protein [Paenibacillus sp. GYB003]|uniref:Gfo/Idh/MocA family protein n=1 Tax=Paenibacillus sp. GYB003 TaxID=2994392 RepID=UPI002F966EEA